MPLPIRARIRRAIFLTALLSAPQLFSEFAHAVEALHLPQRLPDLERRGNWRETLEELSSIGIPQTWHMLGPLANENGKLFERQLDPEKNDDWRLPQTDNLGRLFKTALWTKPKDEDGCYVDFDDAYPAPPLAPLALAGAELDAPVDGPAILWFESTGRAVVYLNNQMVVSSAMTGRKSHQGQYNVLYPITVELKRGRNFLKVKLQKDHKQSLKGWGFFARIERTDFDWQTQLLEKLKQLYPDEAAGAAGAELNLDLARMLERTGKTADAAAAYRAILERFSKIGDAVDEAGDALKRLAAGTADVPGSSGQAWIAAGGRFRTALDLGRTFDADLEMRAFLARFPFSEEAGLALCNRGGLRLDYGWEEPARPFYERAAREFSRNETVRRMSVKGLEFAKYFKPQRAQVETKREVESAFAAIVRQVQDGNAVDCAVGLKALGELLAAQPDALIRFGGSELFPRYASLTQVARAFVKNLDADQKKLFHEPLARAAQSRYDRAIETRNPTGLEDVARKFQGTRAAALALNAAGNMYLDRGQYERAAHAFGALRQDYAGSGVLNDATIAAKERKALGFNSAAEPVSGTEIFGGNMCRTGAPPGSPAPLPGAMEWQRPLEPSQALARARGSGLDDHTFSHIEPYPIVSNGRVFVASRQSFRAFNLADGAELWNKRWDSNGTILNDGFAGYPQSLPCAANGRIFLRAYTADRRSTLRCYNPENGVLIWDTEQNPAVKNVYFSSEPLAAHGLIYAIFFEPVDAEINRFGMLALNERTGAPVWQRYFGSGISGVSITNQNNEGRSPQIRYQVTLQMGPPSASEGVVYSATGLGSVAALNAFTGEILWITEYPKLRAGNLQTGNSGLETFQPRMLKCLARGPSSPVVSGGIVALAPKDSAGVLAFDQASGELRWCRELLDARFIAGVCNGNLLAADDTITALDLKSGRIVWTYSDAGKKLLAQPGYSGSVLYLPMEDGLRRIDARDGKFLDVRAWDQRANAFLGNLVVTPKHIVGVNNGSVLSLGAVK